MDLRVGMIMTGQVTGITKFGAFVAIAGGRSGLVHISEISNTYVSDVNAYLSSGQEVSVKIIGIDESGRINLSIKAAQPAPEQSAERAAVPAFRSAPSAPSSDSTFEDKLKRFMQDSDNKISGLKKHSDRRSPRRRGGR